MKSLNQYIKEKLIVNKNYKDASVSPESFDELRKIIEDRYDKLGPGTKQDPIDFNDIDVSNIRSFCDKNKGGIFQKINFKYIDISYWDVSNIESMRHMFYHCEKLESAGDISKWDVSKVNSMSCMFYYCKELKSVGDISKWDVSNVKSMTFMFSECKKFNQDISNWNVSNVEDMSYMFDLCESFNQDISSWDVSNVIFKDSIFDNCPIKNEYKPKFK